MSTVDVIICAAAAVALVWGLIQFYVISTIPLSSNGDSATTSLTGASKGDTTEKLTEIYTAIYEGAESFLQAEYRICAMFVVGFGSLIFFLISWGTKTSDGWDFTRGGFTALAFLLGAVTSMIAGYLGMKVAVYSNVRTTISAQKAGWTACFNTAFRAGAVMGFVLCGLGLIVLFITLNIMKSHYGSDWETMCDCITGYGLGGSCIAMFGRVGGGIYTKAADVGADLVGKVVHGIPEDDPRNPATIADNVGDNVGDVAGMGSDLFGSFAEATCAALVIGSGAIDSSSDGAWDALLFPVAVSAVGVFVCLICSFIATDIMPVKKETDVELALKTQLISTTLIMLPAVYVLATVLLPDDMVITGVAVTQTVKPWSAFVCVGAGVVGGLIIGLITEYYTSHSYAPVREVADSCKTGAATNMIYGIALGYKSAVIPVIVLSGVIYASFSLLDLYGVSLAAIGMLSNLATGLTIDVYGPVCDNAGGIAEMAELEPGVREKTDALDAAGNTTAAIGKGFAIGSAALVSLALFGAFVIRIQTLSENTVFPQGSGVNMLEPLTFAFLIIGGMIPFWFAAMTMKSVGLAAMEMVMEVSRQFAEKPHLLDEHPTERPDYDACIQISTVASLREMIAPGAMVMFTPLLTGTFFGVNAVAGLLVGSLIASVQLAISMSNSGGAWDNAKKYIERASPESDLKGKGSDVHKAAVVGDTVGDPFKDTSGPALNIVMKLMAVLSLVFADYFWQVNSGTGLFKC
ncbi:hypothetical protein TrRE_jg5746 [Triparma retinervis]|uniref:H(+)-exporting diphosphatase n=1 Tax=Triparma retinervis TaxID=2557542 RepID=A0A9W7DU47_9STRA|nr:hypothetical protein TrRE_jg5746 [Triparma retinervis]